MFRTLLISSLLVSLAIATCPDGYGTSGRPVNGMCPTGFTLMSGFCCKYCTDKINPNTGTSDCPSMAYLCQNSDYRKLMESQCLKTCGYCNTPPTISPAGCADKVNPSTRRSDCPSMASYCSNSAYLSVMQIECPKTCGFCR